MPTFIIHMMAFIVIRTQIQLKEQQMQALKARASQDHVSVSELIRRAVEAWFASEGLNSPEMRRRRAIEATGRFASGQHEVAKRHDEHLADIYSS